MLIMKGRSHRSVVLSLFVLLFLAWRPVRFGRETDIFQKFPIPKPVIRIAIGVDPEDIRIRSSSGLNVYCADEDYRLLAEGAFEVRAADLKEGWKNEGTSLYFIPANPESPLIYRDKEYRGIFILRGGRQGTTLINVLNLEDYLKSVVPGELSPDCFGEIEALKAQAVAARSYALKNIGRFDDLGFDLYATAQSQVYGGMGLERPFSSRAVEETNGEVAVYAGQIINALYTSACGGATESAEEMFGGQAVPYLRSTACVMESEGIRTLQTGRSLPAHLAGGGNVARNIAILAAFGILSPDGGPDWDTSPIPPEEAMAWAKGAAEVLDRRTDGFRLPVEPATPSTFRRWIEEAFGGAEDIEPSAGLSEFGSAADPVAGGSEAAERFLLAPFPASDVRPPMPSPAPDEVLTRAEAAAELFRVLSFSRDPFRRAVFQSAERNVLLVAEEGEIRSLDLDPDPYLLRSSDDAASFCSSLDLAPGDALQWIEREGKVCLLQAPFRPLVDVSDQPSRYLSWHVRISRKDLEARLNLSIPIGELIDLVPVKYGESRRVIELLVVGGDGPARVTGLHIREVLNLRDSLFVIDRETDRTGRITHFIFSGKGWGHGVGLCQVGAYLMARKGATYVEILKTYYRGITIEKRI